MDTLPDPTGIETWPSAMVAIVIILAVAVVPSLFAYLNTRLAREARDSVHEVKKTLTENNGGSTIKDSLDRIEARFDQVEERLGALEARD